MQKKQLEESPEAAQSASVTEIETQMHDARKVYGAEQMPKPVFAYLYMHACPYRHLVLLEPEQAIQYALANELQIKMT